MRKEDYDIDRQLSVILTAIQALGIKAEKTGRNDITKRVFGNAFLNKDFCYHHGTLLLSVDSEQMLILNDSKAKLQSKAWILKSVDYGKSVTNLKGYNANKTQESMLSRKNSAEKIYN